ncbi:MAG: hypothetical protein HY912_13665 [Desulfomonile tiedjei]|uniref:Uncharacterized protein n=1 Tax=Desulfomonile tiedjei TaxID=2358 RepID=A0A9D6V1U9_9BACT|nr:hypothetical protein [Desulfomonile tiedjei]
MRKLIYLGVLLCFLSIASPSHAFLDYLFSGSANKNAIDNSAAGDLRAWWTGNPAYQFNPWYQGGPPPQQGQKPPQQPPQPDVSYYPQQQGPSMAGSVPQGAPGAYQMPQQQYPQQLQQMPQQYQPAPQQFQNPQAYGQQQGVVYPPQAYQQQQQIPQQYPQQYQLPMQQGYPAGGQAQ